MQPPVIVEVEAFHNLWATRPDEAPCGRTCGGGELRCCISEECTAQWFREHVGGEMVIHLEELDSASHHICGAGYIGHNEDLQRC